MSKVILTGAYFGVGAGPTDLSDHVRSLSLETSADIVDATCMTDTWKDRLAGLKDWKVTVEFAQDFASGKVDDTLFSLIGTSVALAIRPTQAAAGAENPEFTGNGILENYNPLDGKVSELSTVKATFVAAGALNRGTGS